MAGDVCLVVRRLALFLFVFTFSLSAPVDKPRSLYDSNDHLTVLTTENFRTTIYSTQNAWFVEFYNSWCGHCIRFAPTWKKLARDIRGWTSVIRLAAIDCAEETNLPTCREFDINGYPSFRYFPAESRNNSKPQVTEIGQRQFTQLRHKVIEYVSDRHSNPQASWPPLAPIEVIETMQQDKRESIQHRVVVFEESQSCIGREVILDLSKYKTVLVRRILKEHASKYEIKKFPSIYKVGTDGKLSRLTEGVIRRDFVMAVMNLIGEKYEDDEVDEEVLKAAVSLISNDTKLQHAVHMQDLESGLHYSLRHEVAGKREMNKDELAALKSYISVLAKFFPGRPPVRLFLMKVHDWLSDLAASTLLGEHWLHAINTLQTEKAYLPTIVRWTGCAGSDPRFRGYPCSLWSLFHTLTVNAQLHMEQGGDFVESTLVLKAMAGYIRNFFGCQECTKNFLKMASTMESEVNADFDEILWLWNAHNRANKRLHGDASEDPSHPKVQFPPKELCPKCYMENPVSGEKATWNKPNVHTFLKAFYGAKAIIQDTKITGGIIPKPDTEKQYSTRGKSLAEKIREKKRQIVDHILNQPLKVDHDKIDFMKKRELDTRIGTKGYGSNAGGFNSIDISLCVMFYLVCSGIILMIYFHFTFRRHACFKLKY